MEELVCQTVMAVATDENALKTAIECGENKGLLRKALDAVKKIAQGVRDFIKGVSDGTRHNLQAQPWVDDLNALDRLAEELSRALDSERAGIETFEQKNNTHGGVRYSIKVSKNGTKYVDVDSTSFDDLNGASLASIISRIISEKYNNLINANGQTIRINSTTNREWLRSENATKLLKASPNIYIDKVKAIENADELLIAARNWIGEEKYHKKSKNKFIEFARGIVDFKIDGREYSCDILVGTKEDGSAVLYDVVNIYEKEISEAPVSKANSSLSSQHASDNETIPYKTDDVKFREKNP